MRTITRTRNALESKIKANLVSTFCWCGLVEAFCFSFCWFEGSDGLVESLCLSFCWCGLVEALCFSFCWYGGSNGLVEVLCLSSFCWCGGSKGLVEVLCFSFCWYEGSNGLVEVLCFFFFCFLECCCCCNKYKIFHTGAFTIETATVEDFYSEIV